MSLFSYLFDNEWSQRSDINNLNHKLSARSTQQRQTNRRVEDLEDELGKTQLILFSLIELLKEKEIWDEAVYLKLKKKIDLMDGCEDNKIQLKREYGE
ncbi:MAG: hypothetical protein AAF492_13865 [Verrucomicrobiota bacterium]